MDNENAIRATPSTLDCEGETTLVYCLEGRPETLLALVTVLDVDADHDLPRRRSRGPDGQLTTTAGACRVWAVSASATHADVAVMLRRASDEAGVDLVFAPPAISAPLCEGLPDERHTQRAKTLVEKAAEGVEGAWKDLRASGTAEGAAELLRSIEVWREARRQAER